MSLQRSQGDWFTVIKRVCYFFLICLIIFFPNLGCGTLIGTSGRHVGGWDYWEGNGLCNPDWKWWTDNAFRNQLCLLHLEQWHCCENSRLRVYLHERDWVDKTILARSPLPDCIEIVKMKTNRNVTSLKVVVIWKKTKKHYEDFLYHLFDVSRFVLRTSFRKSASSSLKF